MFHSITPFTTIHALVGAGAYVPPRPTLPPNIPVPHEAIENIMRARVDIYCGRNQQAVADIRAARSQLRSSHATVSPEAYVGLDEASWCTRHHDHVTAERSLESVLDLILAANAGRS